MTSRRRVNAVWCMTPPLYPVVDERGCNRYFYTDDQYIFSPNIPVTVNALNLKDGLNLKVMVTGPDSAEEFARIKWALQNQEKGTTPTKIEQQLAPGVVLKLFAQDSTNSYVQAGITSDFTGESNMTDSRAWFTFKGVDLKQFVSPSRASGEPWAYTRSFKFEMVVVSTPEGKPIDPRGCTKWDYGRFPENDVPVEVYAICPALPMFLRYEGIPATLLRFALSSRNTQVDNDLNTPYLEAITKRVFNNGFVYERKSGSYAFTSGAGRTFELDKFLQIWNVLNGTASEETKQLYEMRDYVKNKPTVNCFDQTGILGICMSFACKDQNDRDTLIAYFLKPFGFLHPTPLVGFDKGQNKEIVNCNNPFETHRHELLLDQQSQERTKFGTHVFLMFRERIYDACAGPVIGRKFLDYLSSGIDSKEGSYPPKYWEDKNKTQLKTYQQEEVTGGWENARPYRPNDTHGGILGEIENMLHAGAWNQVPKDLNKALDELDFHLDIPGLGDWLKSKTKESKECQVTQVAGPDQYTGAGDINKRADEAGEFIWTLLVSGEKVMVYLRKLPNFETAAAERSAMYDRGTIPGGPNESNLATEKCVSAWIGSKAHATALVGSNIIDCESAFAAPKVLSVLLSHILKFATEGPKQQMKVGNQSADGVDKEGREDPTRRYRISSMPTSSFHYTMHYVVQVSNCLDIDWSYTTGAVFLREYEIIKRADFKLEENQKFAKDPNEEDMDTIYHFQFWPRLSGGDVVKLVFYDRHYKPTERHLEFRVLSQAGRL